MSYLNTHENESHSKERASRLIYLTGALCCFGSLAFAIFYLQDVLWLEPCPYCKLQRVVFIMMGTLFSIFAFVNPKRIFAALSGIILLSVTILGAFIAGKHVYVQTYPSLETTANCTATTDNLVELFDFALVRQILAAKGDCAVVDWTFWGLSIPMLSFLAYVVLGMIGTYTCFCNVRNMRK